MSGSGRPPGFVLGRWTSDLRRLVYGWPDPGSLKCNCIRQNLRFGFPVALAAFEAPDGPMWPGGGADAPAVSVLRGIAPGT